VAGEVVRFGDASRDVAARPDRVIVGNRFVGPTPSYALGCGNQRGQILMYQPVDFPWDADFDFADFRQLVQGLAELLGTAQLRDKSAFLLELRTYAARLYMLGTQMPPWSPFGGDEDSDDSGMPDAEVDPRQAYWRAQHIAHVADTVKYCAGDDDAYHELTWPDEDKVDRTTLSGEITRMYADLTKGAREWDEGRLDDAAFTWIHGFEEGDWGEACLSALRCLHFCVADRVGLVLLPGAGTRDAETTQDAAPSVEVDLGMTTGGAPSVH